MTTPDVAIVGIGIYPFGRTQGISGPTQGACAARRALADAETRWEDVQFAFAGNGSGTQTDDLVAGLGRTGLSYVGVSNGYATGISALVCACQAIRSGAHDVGMVICFDKPRSDIRFRHGVATHSWREETGLGLEAQFGAMRFHQYMRVVGVPPTILSEVASKAFRNGARNPNAWWRRELSPAEIDAAPVANYPLTERMLSTPGEGAVALLVARADHAQRYPTPPIYVRSCEVRSRVIGPRDQQRRWITPIGLDNSTRRAATAAFDSAGIGPRDIDLAQLHDSDAGAEVIHMAETGLCADGEQATLIASKATERSGRLPINTDGGILANGAAVTATGLRQIHENVLQLRGAAGRRQVPGTPQVAFSHVGGAPGVSACTVLTR